MKQIARLGEQLQSTDLANSLAKLVCSESSSLRTFLRGYSKLPTEYEKYYQASQAPVRKPVSPAAAEPVETASPASSADPAQTSSSGESVSQQSDAASSVVDPALQAQRQSAAAVSAWMFPWERRQMDGNSGPLRTWERFYWGLFVGGLALLLFNRLPSRQPEVADPKAAEEKEARRLAGARLLLAGQSSIGDDDEDVFEGLTPQEIQAYTEKALGGSGSSDPFEGMSPEEINEMLSSSKKQLSQ